MAIASEDFLAVLERLRGLTCSNVVAGQGVGTSINLDFGKIVRIKNIQTSGRSREMPIYETSIFVQDATWRLEDLNSVICSSAADSNAPRSALVLGLNRLLHQEVVKASTQNVAQDLMLTFRNGLALLVFSVPISSESDVENYSIFTAENVFAVEFDGKITVSARTW